MYDELDLEDIECRLYSQVYHSTVENEKANASLEPTVTSYAAAKIHNNRYFSKGHISGHSVYIPFEQENSNTNKTCSSVHNNISFNGNSTAITTEGNFGSQIQNNITVNQYTLPLIINSDLSEVLDPKFSSSGKLLVPLSVKNKRIFDRKLRRQQKRLENRRRKKEKANQNSITSTYVEISGNAQRNKVNHVVFISDESDNECVTVSEMSKKTLKCKEGPEVLHIQDNAEFESDDDIIYIPPPPVEIINVDVDVEEGSIENINNASDNVSSVAENTSTSADQISSDNPNCHSNELSNTIECTSNDFLDNSNIENNTSKFNFSLHGSDFNNTGDFVRPANPVDYCETESSCSTNDFNRENSSVKTIVFNEVDFPREDIFSDKNLEDFGSYITPKRNSLKISKIPSKTSKSTRLCNTISNESETSLSSSESDYDSTDILTKTIQIGDIESNKKLPTLSPMHGERIVVPKTKLKKKKSTKSGSNKVQEALGARNHSDKRKSNALDCTESDSDVDEEELKLTTRKSTKKKKKGSSKKNYSSELDNISTDLQNQNAEIHEDVHDGGNPGDGENMVATLPETYVKKKVKISEKTIVNEGHLKHTGNEICDCAKDREDCLTNTNESVENDTDHTSVSRKKKKKNSSNCKRSKENRTSLTDLDRTTLEKIKRKKKKSLSSENSGVNVNVAELNQSQAEVIDASANTENENLKDKDQPTLNNNKNSFDPLEEVHDEPQNEKNLCTKRTENKCDSDKASSKGEFQNSRKNSVQNINQANDVLEEIKSDEEIIVVDEVVSHESDTNAEDHIEIVSSDSEDDFRQLNDVGQDLELANCLTNRATKESGIYNTENDFTRFYATNKNLCEDYSKFDVEQIQSTQSDNPEFWKILPRDELTYLNPKGNKGPRCNRCRQFGHIAVRCTEKPDAPRCTLCGFSGHQEPRCPNKRCTQCGNEGDYSTTFCWKCVKFRNSICRICNMRGHIANTCPDLWRRYHLTTQEGSMVVSQEPQLKSSDQLWCSGCAGQGHLEHECNYYNREYPPSNPCIISYEDVLNQGGPNRTLNTTPSPPPPPVWNIQNQNNFYQNMSSFHSFPSTSQNIPYHAPIFIPPLMSQIINPSQLFPVPAILSQNQMMVPNSNINSNPIFPPVTTKVLNPFSVLVKQGEDATKHRVLNQMMINYVNNGNNINYAGCYDSDNGKMIHPHMVKRGINELLKNDQRRIKQIIMSMPSHSVKQFLVKELDELENVVSQSDPNYLKKMLTKYTRISQSKKVLSCDVVKEKCFWNRILNMLLFGVHQFRDGNLHINFIKKFISEPKQNKLDNHKRKSLLNAYNYIFVGDRHVNVNYHKILQQLIEKYNRNN